MLTPDPSQVPLSVWLGGPSSDQLTALLTANQALEFVVLLGLVFLIFIGAAAAAAVMVRG